MIQVIAGRTAWSQTFAMNNNSHSQSLSLPAVLTAAPHRLLFFAGALNVLAAMAWWTWWLFHTVPLPVEQVTGGWLHGFIVQYQMLPSFMFGFLITVFPRWMGQAEPTRRHYVPVGLGMLLGQVLCLAAAFTGSAHALHLGVVLTILGWGYGLVVLGTVLVRNRFQTWHAVSCYTALTIGFLGLLGFAVYLHSFGRPFNLWLGQAVMQIGTFGVLLPIYATVAHRMFPFFAGNVVAGYQSWRPMWLLGAQWPFWLLHVGLEASGHKSWLWLADAPLLLIALVCLWKWWPRGKAPGILRVLFLGYVWLPVALLLYVVQSVWLQLDGAVVLGKAPLHALTIGVFGSLLVAMVTRVSQGHSGRPLVLVPVALFAFSCLQLVALTRVLAELMETPWSGFRVAAVGWLVAFLPWALRYAWIYLRPRADGRPG